MNTCLFVDTFTIIKEIRTPPHHIYHCHAQEGMDFTMLLEVSFDPHHQCTLTLITL